MITASSLGGGDTSLDVAGELGLVLVLVVLSELLHVGADVTSKDVLAEDLGVERATLSFLVLLVTDEALGGVGDVKSTVDGSLETSEDAGSGGGAGKTSIEDGVEGTTSGTRGLDGVLLGGILSVSDKVLVETELGKVAAGNEETDGVDGSVVGVSDGESVSGELVGVGSSEDDITSNGRVGDLGDNILVGDADDQSVLGGIVLVLVLGHKALTGIVVGLSLCSTQYTKETKKEGRALGQLLFLFFFLLQKEKGSRLLSLWVREEKTARVRGERERKGAVKVYLVVGGT